MMINIIKAEIKRLTKSKGFWFSLGLFIFIYALCIFMQNSAQTASTYATSPSAGEPGFYVSIDAVVKTLNTFATMFGHSFGTLILGIYLAIFVCNEYSSGYIKNIITLSHGRIANIISKMIIATIIDLMIIVISYAVAFILGNLIVTGFTIEPVNIIVKYAFIMFVMTLALLSLIIFVTVLLRNKIIGIIIILLISSGMLQSFLISFFDLIHMSFLSQYTLSSFFLNTALVSGNDYIKVIGISVFYAVVYMTSSVMIMSKRDI